MLRFNRHNGSLAQSFKGGLVVERTLKPGRLVWIAVEKEHPHNGYGTKLNDMPMKPVVLISLFSSLN
jgi:hypothetical protein